MGCPRCGQSRPRPISSPTVVGRPGGVSVPGQRPAVPSSPLSPNIIRDSITGLRYIPNGRK